MSQIDLNTAAPDAVTGVQLAQGVGVQEARGFWADAWSQVLKRRGAICGLTWIGIVVFFALFSPLLANGHPWRVTMIDTRTGADAAADFETRFGMVSDPDRQVVRGWLLRELQRHSPRLAPEDFMPGDEPTLTEAQVQDAIQRLASHEDLNATGDVAAVHWPLIANLTGTDVLLMVGGTLGLLFILLPLPADRSTRGVMLFFGSIHAAAIVIGATALEGAARQSDAAPWLAAWRSQSHFSITGPLAVAAFVSVAFLAVPSVTRFLPRVAWVGAVGVLAGACALQGWGQSNPAWDYRAREARGEIRALHALVPFSPTQSGTEYYNCRPGSGLYEGLALRVRRAAARTQGRTGITDEALAQLRLEGDLARVVRDEIALGGDWVPESGDELAAAYDAAVASGEVTTPAEAIAWLRTRPSDRFILGTDARGQDVLSQILHGSRLSISIGFVSTSIATMIGVTIGALMGYFGGKVDLILYRVVEIFMAIPVLFLLIVASGVLPKSTYVMMAIIGCVTWTGAARFVRAEFYKLRNQDFVQSARAAGLPLRSILFKHMLPNGVTPVLVDASFAIAAAILAEATLSFLGLGPENQASWGRLLSGATGDAGTFQPWLALYPGAAIFLTVLSYNLVGEAMRDAIDPRLRKARV